MSRRKREVAVDGELSERELAFIAHYLRHFNGARAAREAGYAKKGAKVQASKILDRARVIEELERRRAKLMEKIELSHDRVLEELRRVGLSNMRDLVRSPEEGGGLKELDELTEEQAASISELIAVPQKVGAEIVIKVLPGKRYNKVGALKILEEALRPLGTGAGAKVAVGAGATVVVHGGPTGLEVEVIPGKAAAEDEDDG